MDVEIRRAVGADAGDLSNLARRAKAHWGYPPEWMRRWKADLTLTPKYLDSRNAYVAQRDGRPIGMCVLELHGEDATLEHVWITPEFHRQGIGRHLVVHALDTARRAGVVAVKVVADPFAEAFYLKLGAQRIGTVPAPMPGAPRRVLPLLEFAL